MYSDRFMLVSPTTKLYRMSEQLLFNISNKRKKRRKVWRMWAAIKERKKKRREEEEKRRWLRRWMLYPTWQAKIISHYSKFDAPLTRTCRPEGGYLLYLYVILYTYFSRYLYASPGISKIVFFYLLLPCYKHYFNVQCLWDRRNLIVSRHIRDFNIR